MSPRPAPLLPRPRGCASSRGHRRYRRPQVTPPWPRHFTETTARPFRPHPRQRSRPLRSRILAAGLSPVLTRGLWRQQRDLVAGDASVAGKATRGKARYGGFRCSRLQGRRRPRHNHARRGGATPLNRPAMSSWPIAADGSRGCGNWMRCSYLSKQHHPLTIPNFHRLLASRRPLPAQGARRRGGFRAL
jgi:hypothetical protein